MKGMEDKMANRRKWLCMEIWQSLKVVHVCIIVCTCHIAHGWDDWLLLWRQGIPKWTRCVCVYKYIFIYKYVYARLCVYKTQLAAFPLDLSPIWRRTKHIYSPGFAPRSRCVCYGSVLAGHWLPIHELGIPRWKRYVRVCVRVHLEPLGYRWDSKCWTVLFDPQASQPSCLKQTITTQAISPTITMFSIPLCLLAAHHRLIQY